MKHRWIFVLIILISLCLRLYKIGQIPNGFANDEAAITYQAYSILKTGKDTWGNFLPLLSFKDFGEYLPPFAVYAQVPFIKIFGLNEFAARLPFVLTSPIMVFAIYELVIGLFRNRNLALLSAFLFAVSPLNIGWSRFVYEGNFGTLFLLLAITFLVLAFKRIKFLPVSIFFFGLTLTTYHIYFLLSPLILAILLIPNLRKFWSKDRKIFLWSILIGLIFTIYGALIIASGSGRERFRQVSIFNKSELLAQLTLKQMTCSQNFPYPICRIFFNKATTYLGEYTYNYFFQFSPTFLAINGTFLRSTILPYHGLIYPFEIAFFYLGITYLLYLRNRPSFILLTWLATYPLASSFTTLGEISRIGHVMPLFPIISSLGIIKFIEFINKVRFKKLIVSSLCVFATFNIFSFLIDYFVIFPKTNSQYSNYAYVELFKKIRNDQNKFSRYFITRDYLGSSPEFQARIFLPIDPEAFQDPTRNDYMTKYPQKYYDYKRLDNFFFFSSRGEIESTEEDLVVVSKNQLEARNEILFEIREPNEDLSLIGIKGGN